MKRLLLLPLLALALLTGCKNVGNTITPALVQASVSSSVRFGIAKYPTARPAVTVGVEVICSQANGTNISPAAIVAAIEASNYASLKTPEAVFITQAIVQAYTIAWNSFAAGSVSNSVVRPYLQAVCSGGTEGLGGVGTLTTTDRRPTDWPQLTFP